MMIEKKTGLPYEVAIVAGRWQLYHRGQGSLVDHAFSIADSVVIVIGSARRAPTPKNPLSAAERQAMISATLTPEQLSRVQFVWARDFDDNSRWVASVYRDVNACHPSATRRALVGHFKDDSSSYLNDFPGWALVAMPRHTPTDATKLREALFTLDESGARAALAPWVAPAALEFIMEWRKSPTFETMVHDFKWLKGYWAKYGRDSVFHTGDVIIRCQGRTLVTRRRNGAGKGLRCIQGGFRNEGESDWDCALRECEEELGLRFSEEDLRTLVVATKKFEAPDRSLRAHIKTTTLYIDLGDRPFPEIVCRDDVDQPEWLTDEEVLAEEATFFDDHFQQINDRWHIVD